MEKKDMEKKDLNPPPNFQIAGFLKPRDIFFKKKGNRQELFQKSVLYSHL